MRLTRQDVFLIVFVAAVLLAIFLAPDVTLERSALRAPRLALLILLALCYAGTMLLMMTRPAGFVALPAAPTDDGAPHRPALPLEQLCTRLC